MELLIVLLLVTRNTVNEIIIWITLTINVAIICCKNAVPVLDNFNVHQQRNECNIILNVFHTFECYAAKL